MAARDLAVGYMMRPRDGSLLIMRETYRRNWLLPCICLDNGRHLLITYVRGMGPRPDFSSLPPCQALFGVHRAKRVPGVWGQRLQEYVTQFMPTCHKLVASRHHWMMVHALQARHDRRS